MFDAHPLSQARWKKARSERSPEDDGEFVVKTANPKLFEPEIALQYAIPSRDGTHGLLFGGHERDVGSHNVDLGIPCNHTLRNGSWRPSWVLGSILSFASSQRSDGEHYRRLAHIVDEQQLPNLEDLALVGL